MTAKTVVILGGGIGGVVAANILGKKLGRSHRILLIDRKRNHEFSPSFPWLMLGWRTPDKIVKDLGLLEKKGVKYVQGEVQNIDLGNRRVATSAGEYTYDYLIIAVGAELNPEGIPGLSAAAYHNYDLESAVRVGEAIKTFSKGTIAIGVSKLPFKCPAAPYEAALLMDYYFRKKGIRDKVNFEFFTPEPLPMPSAGEVVGNMVKDALAGRGIPFHPRLNLVNVDRDKGELTFDNGEKIRYDLLFAVPPHKAPKVVRDAGLTDSTGWVPVNMKTMETKHTDMYAVGDATAIKLPSGMMLPKAGVFAHRQAEAVARNIISDISGGGEHGEFDGFGSCFIEMGYGKAGYASGNFYTEPKPQVKPRRPGRIWHWGRVLFEKYWLWRWF